MGWLDEAPDKETRVLLLVALRDITDGKIFVEAERAKLTRMLAEVCLYVLGSAMCNVYDRRRKNGRSDGAIGTATPLI